CGSNPDQKAGSRCYHRNRGPEERERAPDNPGDGDREAEAISNAQSRRDRARSVVGSWDLWRSTCADALGLGTLVRTNTTANRARDPVPDRLRTRHGVRPPGGFILD